MAGTPIFATRTEEEYAEDPEQAHVSGRVIDQPILPNPLCPASDKDRAAAGGLVGAPDRSATAGDMDPVTVKLALTGR